jgi:hypothetical protein
MIDLRSGGVTSAQDCDDVESLGDAHRAALSSHTPREAWRSRAVVIGVLSLALVGCGGGGGSAGRPSGAVRRKFVARANGVCARADAKARSLLGPADKLDPKSLDRVAALLDQTATELARLSPPPALRAGYRRYVVLARQEISLVNRLADDVRTRNAAGVRELEGQLNGNASNRAARELGLTVCAKEVS